MEPHSHFSTPPRTAADKVIAAAGWLVLLATWGLVAASYAGLPPTIPIHYDAAGQPNGYGDRFVILTLPLLATVLSTSLAALGKRPQVLNYPVAITAANAGAQYANATRLLRYLQLALGLVFGLLTLGTIRTAHGQAEGLGAWSLPLMLGLVFGPLAYFVVRARRLKGELPAGPGG